MPEIYEDLFEEFAVYLNSEANFDNIREKSSKNH